MKATARRCLLLLSLGLLPRPSYALGDRLLGAWLYGALAMLMLGLAVALGTGFLTKPRLVTSRWEALFFAALAAAGAIAYWLKK